MADPRIEWLTIPSGQTLSNELELHRFAGYRGYAAWVWAPATLPETVKMEGAPFLEDDPVGFAILQSGGIDITFPAARITPLLRVVAARVRLVAGSAVSGDRTFVWRAVAVEYL